MNHRNVTTTKTNIIAMKCALYETALNVFHYEQIHEFLDKAFAHADDNGNTTLCLTKRQKSELYEVCVEYANEMETEGRNGYETLCEAAKALA